MQDYIELFIGIFTLLGIIYAIIRAVILWQVRTQQNKKKSEDHDEILKEINAKLEPVPRLISGLEENTRQTKALHGRMDGFQTTITDLVQKQVELRTEVRFQGREIDRLRDTQKIYPERQR